MSDYDTDVLEWSERQSTLLRRLAAGERVNDRDLDWPNLAEEIESVGRRELRATESLIIQALAHLMKIEAWPDSIPAPRWRIEADHFRWQARRSFTPSMRQHIDMEELYQRALKWLPPEIDGAPPLAVPKHCPMTLDEFLAES